MNSHSTSNPTVEDTRSLLDRFGDEPDGLIVDADVADKINKCDEALAYIFDRIGGSDAAVAESAMNFVKQWLFFETSFTRQIKDAYEMAVTFGASSRGEDSADAVVRARPSFMAKLEADRKRNNDLVGPRMNQAPRHHSDSDENDGEHAVQSRLQGFSFSQLEQASMQMSHQAFQNGGVLQINTIFSDDAVPPPIPNTRGHRRYNSSRAPLSRAHRDGGRRRERERDARRFSADANEPHERSRSGRRNGRQF